MEKYYKHYNYYDLKDSETVGDFTRLTILDNSRPFSKGRIIPVLHAVRS